MVASTEKYRDDVCYSSRPLPEVVHLPGGNVEYRDPNSTMIVTVTASVANRIEVTFNARGPVIHMRVGNLRTVNATVSYRYPRGYSRDVDNYLALMRKSTSNNKPWYQQFERKDKNAKVYCSRRRGRF